MHGLKTKYLQKLKGFIDSGSHQWPRLKSPPFGRRILVLAPHFDDETIGCGGTLALHAKAGVEVTVAFLTDGSSGDRDHIERDIVSARKAEAKRACALLGVSNIIFFDEKDGSLEPRREVCEKVAETVSKIRPDAVFAPWPYDDDRDHRACALILAEAAKDSPGYVVYSYEVWSPMHPNVTVDVTAVADTKENALREYVSQLRYKDLIGSFQGLGRYRSILNLRGRGYAEAFIESSKIEHASLASL
jgi:N-acetylglucosamine malate deacetylase 1